jgi:uncharacterized membrane protein required for colicin V production
MPHQLEQGSYISSNAYRPVTLYVDMEKAAQDRCGGLSSCPHGAFLETETCVRSLPTAILWMRDMHSREYTSVALTCDEETSILLDATRLEISALVTRCACAQFRRILGFSFDELLLAIQLELLRPFRSFLSFLSSLACHSRLTEEATIMLLHLVFVKSPASTAKSGALC